MELNIDKTGWKSVKFGEVCLQVNETARNPQEEGLIHVVGLEHIGSNDLHIRSWNTLERETTFTRKFVKGQVLFGRRRAYQAKVAYAEFDGICSGDILVFETIKSKLLPELLPFMVQSQKFYNKAVETSAGSLSPRTKFKDLADLEFLLPPKDQQARLAELLWAADEVGEREKEVKEGLENALKLYMAKECGTCNNGNYLVDISNLAKISSLLSNQKYNVGKLDTTEYKMIGGYPIVDQSMSFIVGYSNTKELVFDGELPILVFGDHTTIIKYVDFPFILGADGTKIIYPNKNRVLPKFLYYAIKNLNLIPQGYRRHYSILKDLMVPVFEVEKQRSVLGGIEEFEKPIESIKLQINVSQAIKKGLINEIF